MLFPYTLTSHLSYTIIISKCQLGINEEREREESLIYTEWDYCFFQSIIMIPWVTISMERRFTDSLCYIVESLSFQTRTNDGSIWFLSARCFFTTHRIRKNIDYKTRGRERETKWQEITSISSVRRTINEEKKTHKSSVFRFSFLFVMLSTLSIWIK